MRKLKRDRLFKRGRTYFRPLIIRDGNKYTKDVGFLWVAHSKKPFYAFEDITDQKDFAKKLEEIASSNEMWIAEDSNKEFKDKGPIALVAMWTDGWRVEPHTEFFPWATKRNILNSTVSFLQNIRYKKPGVIMIYSLESSKALFDKVCEYGVLFYTGKVINGDPRGDIWLYTIKGKGASNVRQ